MSVEEVHKMCAHELNEKLYDPEYTKKTEELTFRKIHIVQKPITDPKRNPDGVGTYIWMVEFEGGCPKCGYDRGRMTYHEPGGVGRVSCSACGEDLVEIPRV